MKLIRDRLKVAQSRQKSYADSKRKETVYKVGDKVYLRASPLRGVKRFGVKGKLASCFVGHTKYWNVWEKLPTSWSCPKDCQAFMCVSRFLVEEVPRGDGRYPYEKHSAARSDSVG